MDKKKIKQLTLVRVLLINNIVLRWGLLSSCVNECTLVKRSPVKQCSPGRVTGDNSICLANWKIWCVMYVCVLEQVYWLWLTGWLVGWLAADLSGFFLAFDMSKTSVFRLKSLFRFFSQKYTNTQCYRFCCCCCFGSLLFFFHPDSDSKNHLTFLLWHKIQNEEQKRNW